MVISSRYKDNQVNFLKFQCFFFRFFNCRYLYAVGGQDGVSCLNIVERYDSKANTWTRIAPMCCRRLGRLFW